jgi:hypothetical protein
MGFKSSPARLVVADTFIANLPRRLTGRPLIDPRTVDREVCSAIYRYMILTAFDATDALITDIKLLGGRCLALGTCLDVKTKTTNLPTGAEPDDVYIICANCTPGGTEAASSSSVADSSMQLCLSAYGSYLSQSLVNGLVFREFIRLCGGKELDAWALYYYFFQSSVDALSGMRSFFPVPSIVKDYMCAGSAPLGAGSLSTIRVGTFVIWYTNFGQLYPRSSGGTVGTVGSSLTGSSHPYWQHMCP